MNERMNRFGDFFSFTVKRGTELGFGSHGRQNAIGIIFCGLL